jgi:hypothetical protein
VKLGTALSRFTSSATLWTVAAVFVWLMVLEWAGFSPSQTLARVRSAIAQQQGG